MQTALEICQALGPMAPRDKILYPGELTLFTICDAADPSV